MSQTDKILASNKKSIQLISKVVQY